MKKSTTKASKSPAPATKPVAAKAAPTKKKATPAAALVATPAPVTSATRAEVAKPVAVAPAPTPVAARASVQPVAAKPVVTTITANVDVGFGNALFVRGEGPGLSWDRGLAMDCVAGDKWQVTLPQASSGYTFKLLLNDNVWSKGPDYTVASGAQLTLTPEF